MGASNDSGVAENGNFQRFLWLFFGNFRDEASVISDMQSIVSFSVITKCITLNDLESLFRVKFCFRTGFAGSTVRLSKNNYVKIDEDRHILSAAQIFGRDSSFWQYKVCADIRSGSLERKR